MDAESAAMDDYDHYTILSPKEKAYQVAGAKMDLGRFPPSTLLKSADEYDYIPELLEEAACLVPYYNLLTETKRLIRIDDKDQFASFLKANHELVLNYPPEGILELLCKHSVVACATALLESHPNLDLDPSHYVGLSALEMAVSNLSYGMIKLLLEHGADADIECGAGATPLHIALNAFKSCYSKFWTGEESIVRLFHVFSLPELKEPLDTLRVLASHSKQVEDICIRSMNIGCVRDYAALLMVAWDKLMVSSADGGGA